MGSQLRSALALLCLVMVVSVTRVVSQNAGSKLQMYVDELPKIPKIKGYEVQNGVPRPTKLTIGMYQKKWKFHRDLPESEVFVYGKTSETATFPGPTIEAIQDVTTYVKWVNYLPKNHILPWDPTIPTAIPKKYGGVPGVVHLHGGVHEPQSDGSPFAWFTAGFKERGPMWSKSTYTYPNIQHPGILWYHDHALGLTRENLLAGLLGPYIIKNHTIEAPFNLPSGPKFDRILIIADRSFNTDGSIYMNKTGNNPSVHPQWQPEYFGDAITVNGKAWPFLKVQRRKYRFRIINVSNARYFHLQLSNGMKFTVVGTDTTYLNKPVTTSKILLSPAESFDVILDFSAVNETEIEVTNDAPYPYPSGTAASIPNSRVMKFTVEPTNPNPNPNRNDKIPSKLMNHQTASAAIREAKVRRFIVMYEYTSSNGEVTHLYINGKRLMDPVTEMPRVGSTEVWEVINLTGDDHPLHLHLVAFQATKIQLLADLQNFTNCMIKVNDAVKCNVDKHVTGRILKVPEHEKAWKNIVKIEPGAMTTIVVKFKVASTDEDYPFDVTADPGYVYHCHILDHEDNEMIRPMKLVY